MGGGGLIMSRNVWTHLVWDLRGDLADLPFTTPCGVEVYVSKGRLAIKVPRGSYIIVNNGSLAVLDLTLDAVQGPRALYFYARSPAPFPFPFSRKEVGVLGFIAASQGEKGKWAGITQENKRYMLEEFRWHLGKQWAKVAKALGVEP